LLWDKTEKIKARTHRKVAKRLLCSKQAVKSRVLSASDDVRAFSPSMLGSLDTETQVVVFDHVAGDEGVAAFLRLCSVCRWMHFIVRTFMHTTLQEQACRLTCSNISLLPVSTPGSYIEQLEMEMRGSLALRLMKKAFSMLELHCASPHCSVAMRAYNQALVSDACSAKQARCSRRRVPGLIRVAYDRVRMLEAAHDATVAFVSTNDERNTDRIVRVDATQANTVWSPHSEMAVSDVVKIEGPTDELTQVCWMSASHDGTALLYAVSEGVDVLGHKSRRKTFLWDMDTQASYAVRFVAMVGERGLPVEPCNHGWHSIGGWFRKSNKGTADRDCLDFAVVFQNRETVTADGIDVAVEFRHSIWQHRFVRSSKGLVCLKVGFEASDVLGPDDSLHHSISSDVSGRWLGCRVRRGHGASNAPQFLGCMIDIDGDDDAVIFCCPKAFSNWRFVVHEVAVSPAGDKLAMTCRGGDQTCTEVHKRISETACIRLMRVASGSSSRLYHRLHHGMDGHPHDAILTFSPCGRFVVWSESLWLRAVAVSEEPVEDGFAISEIDIAPANTPRGLCWRGCGVWMRLQRGAVFQTTSSE
jgi:hypothetical protein